MPIRGLLYSESVDVRNQRFLYLLFPIRSSRGIYFGKIIYFWLKLSKTKLTFGSNCIVRKEEACIYERGTGGASHTPGPAKLGGPGGAMAPPLFCQAKLYVELDFKISTEALNFEIIHSIY